MKIFFTPLTRRLGSRSKLWRTAGVVLGLLAGSEQAQAQFPRVEPFKNSTATGFRVGGNATLTGGAVDTQGDGYLRLTGAVDNQAGFAIDGTSFPTPNGFSISFEFFSYGKTSFIGADGFSVFLVDADQVTSAAAFTSGASGGSLGYAQKIVPNEPTNPTNSNGVSFGYIGIGIDEYGNFSNPTESRVGGRTTGAGITRDGRTPNSIAIRGAGNGRGPADYPYLAGTGVLPFALEATTPRAQNGSADYRRAFIDALPQPDQSYLITVRIQYGNQVYTAINKLRVPKAPNNLRIGFAGSTGNNNNVHEIRSLAIVKSPFANDDLAGTRYDRPVTLNAVSNDIFPGSQFQVGSLDLDIEQSGIQNTLTIDGKGTFTADANGQVTFTPSGSFAGVVTAPYTVRDILYSTTNPSESSPATITVIVNGADVATSVSGPTSANPGARITYNVSTSNLGTESTANLVPTIQLPAGLSGVSVSSGTYDSGSGLVTFSTIASLAANATPISNTVTFTVPASGSLTGTATFRLPPGVPDPVTGNNTATITTTIRGQANVAALCATPGKDGPAILDATAAPNTYFPGQGSALSGANTITLDAALLGANAATTGISAGDLLLIMQMQGADINTTNTAAYGSNGTAGSGNLPTNFTAGQYEYAIATNTVTATGGTLTLASTLVNSYSNVDYTADGTMTGQRRFQVIRVPQYSSLTLTGAVTGAAWNGRTGGVLVFDVAGKTTFDTNSSLDMRGKGFRGGGGKVYTGIATYSNTDYVQPAIGAHGSKGEGTAGTPLYVNNDYANLLTAPGNLEGYRNGSNGRGAPGNAGGGATDRNPANNTENSGGGGGSNGGNGGTGGLGWTALTTDVTTGGIGGVPFAGSAARLVLGGGGGAGSTNDGSPARGTIFDGLASSGADGGGIVLLRTGFIAGTGQILADGAAGALVDNDGGGGGGAGGSVLLLSANAAGLNNITISAAGGNGGNTNPYNAESHGPGGGGGGGLVFSNGELATASSVAPGAPGTTTTSSTENFGATAGTAGRITPSVAFTQPNSITGANSCLPELTVALATSTPNVTRNGTGVNPAAYVLTVSNTGGAATGVSLSTALTADIFQYDATVTPVVTLTLADGNSTAITDYTAPTSSVSAPTFSNLAIPAGATLSVKFQAFIAASAVNNFAYQATSVASYSSPLRDNTPTTAMVSPGGNYAGGTNETLGAAGGTNYSASASTAEDVTIVRPLPVELKSFTVAAARTDAKLTWETASELNNDRFIVERSIDGITFTPIGSVQGKGTSHKLTTYGYNDAGIGHSQTQVYYRLKQLDFDGAVSFSPVRAVKFVDSAIKTAVSVYPNPTQAGATLDLTGLPAGDYQVQLLDLTGRTLGQFTLMGQREHALPVQALPQGSYIVRVRGKAVSVALPLVRN